MTYQDDFVARWTDPESGKAYVLVDGQWQDATDRDIPPPDDTTEQAPHLIRWWGARAIYERVDDPSCHWFIARDGDDWLPALFDTLHAAWAAFDSPRETVARLSRTYCAVGADYSGRWKGRPLTIEDLERGGSA